MAATAEPLADRKCAPCKAGAASLTDAQLNPLLQSLPGWQLDGKMITKTYTFKDHYQAQAFTNAVMWVSHRQDHHPALTVGYNTVKVEYWTHTVDGLSENDFICAAKLDKLLDI